MLTCHPVLPHPFQNIVLHLLKNLQTTTPPLINIKNLREPVSQVYSLSQAILLSFLPSRNSKTNVFEEPLHFPSNSGSHVFPIIHLVMTCFLFKCSKNILELFRTFIELAGSIKVLNKFLKLIRFFFYLFCPFFSFFLYILSDPRLQVLSASVLCTLQVAG